MTSLTLVAAQPRPDPPQEQPSPRPSPYFSTEAGQLTITPLGVALLKPKQVRHV